MTSTFLEPRRLEILPADSSACSRAGQLAFNSYRWMPWIWLAVTLPAVLLLCFLVPPMQNADEGRHFLRACQIAQGDLLSQIDPGTGRAGGWLPSSAVTLVRRSMTLGFQRQQDSLPSIRARMSALDRDSQMYHLSRRSFAAFPSAAIYAPALYAPQAAAITVARLFSGKAYVWFYSARVFNALFATGLVVLALWYAPKHQALLMLVTSLPMSISLFASVASDAEIIALSVTFVSFAIRFRRADSFAIRFVLISTLVLLTVGKPVYLALGLLLLAAYPRLGWRRGLAFFSLAVASAGTCYLGWWFAARPFFLHASQEGIRGANPVMQARFALAHPLGMAKILLLSVGGDLFRLRLFKQAAGVFGWMALPMPAWFYAITLGLFAALLILLVTSCGQISLSKFIVGGTAVVGLVIATYVAGWIEWTPVGSGRVFWIQGRYFLPALAVIAFVAPPIDRWGAFRGACAKFSIVAFLLLSVYSTLEILDHYFFERSAVIGRDIRRVLAVAQTGSCPASLDSMDQGWFSLVGNGRTQVSGGRVLFTDSDGRILAESDPVLSRPGFLLNRLMGWQTWRFHTWNTTRPLTGRLWLVVGNSACSFGPPVPLRPVRRPEI